MGKFRRRGRRRVAGIGFPVYCGFVRKSSNRVDDTLIV